MEDTVNLKKQNNVTVVIPVYDDWNTLSTCIESLKKYLDKRHSVILVNDAGPSWETIERKIQESIIDYPNFRYEKNPQNIGFVKTCNRAVSELDTTENDVLLLNSDTEVTEGFMEEMLQVLYATEKHGVVCPRSNCATIFSVPAVKDPSYEVTPEENYRIYQKIRNLLPQYQVMPTAVGFAMLIKRRLIRDYGLFDEIYSPGYNEENDFCMRINQYGHSVLAANRAFVFHYESKSFGSRRNELDLKHSQILLKRYPYYSTAVKMYQQNQINAVDYYADIIGGLYDRKKVLVDLYEVPSVFNGTAQYGLSFLKSFYELFRGKYDISVLINEAADVFHGVSKKYPKVYHPDNISERFDIAYTPSQIINAVHWHVLNRVSLKYVFCMQDIISLRSNYLLTDDWERREIFEQSIKYADGIVFISGFSDEETKTYYNEEFAEREIKTKVIYHGRFFDNKKTADEETKLPFDDYVAVIGNHYKHKNLLNVLPSLKKMHFNFIVIGNSFTGKVADNIYGYRTGNLSDEFLRAVYKKSRAILFPSVYEGFGLPILTAIDFGKGIVVNDNELNNELIKEFDPKRMFVFKFDDIGKIEESLEKAVNVQMPAPDDICSRSWRNVAEDVEEMLSEVMSEDIDIKRLRERWESVRYASNIHRGYVAFGNQLSVKSIIKGRLIEHIKRRPRIYGFLKRIKVKMQGRQSGEIDV